MLRSSFEGLASRPGCGCQGKVLGLACQGLRDCQKWNVLVSFFDFLASRSGCGCRRRKVLGLASQGIRGAVRIPLHATCVPPAELGAYHWSGAFIGATSSAHGSLM